MLLLDNSAWARLASPALPDGRRDEIASMMEDGDLAVCTPFLLEAGWSAQNGPGHDELVADLLQLPHLEIDADVEETAIAAQCDLAHRGRHRTASPVDLLIAACGHRYAVGVLHYDRDYDTLFEFTALDFESQWLVAPGML